MQWAVGLELLLLIDDPWRVFLTTDHPNGGCFWRYPEIIQLLMDAEFRKEQIKALPAEARKRIVLADLDREYTLSEIAIITLGGAGARAGPDAEGTPRRRRRRGRRHLRRNSRTSGILFGYPRYVIKGGEVVVEEGEIRTVGRRAASSSSSPRSTSRSRTSSAPAVPEGLHDVVRELSGGDRADRRHPDVTSLQVEAAL